MCLLVVVSRPGSATPLVVGANRDERLERPATAVTVLRRSGPRILGGRDEEAGGTWLAVNEHGVVAGLTNRPSPEGRDPSKKSRGELPLALAAYRDARSAVEDFATRFRAADYNPAWLLVGDRTSLFALDMTGAGTVDAGTGARVQGARARVAVGLWSSNWDPESTSSRTTPCTQTRPSRPTCGNCSVTSERSKAPR